MKLFGEKFVSSEYAGRLPGPFHEGRETCDDDLVSCFISTTNGLCLDLGAQTFHNSVANVHVYVIYYKRKAQECARLWKTERRHQFREGDFRSLRSMFTNR